MKESPEYYAKWKKPDQRVLAEWFHLNEILEKTKQLWEKKQNTECQETGQLDRRLTEKERERMWVFMHDGGDDVTACICRNSLNYTLKIDEVLFM